MKVQDIMTPPTRTCAPETSLVSAARLMRESDYGTLPVVDRRGRLHGIITERDICMAMAASYRSAANIAVHEAMTENVFTVSPDDDVHLSLETMKRHRVRRLPVCDTVSQLKGILSIEDVIVRGLEGGGVTPGEIAAALREMYVHELAGMEMTPADNGFTPG